MSRRLLVALVLVAACVGAAQPVGADHESPWYGHWPSGQRAITFQDRSGNATMRQHLSNAANEWNAVGAGITVAYSVGPADNACAPSGTTVPFCISTGTSYAAAFFPETSGGHLTGGYVLIRSDSLGAFGPRHEGGHALGLDHSNQYSVMNTGNLALQSSTITEHDRQALRDVYSHTDAQRLCLPLLPLCI